jgi:hypothetical protein
MAMTDARHHIHLVAGFELRPPAAEARFQLTRDESERLGAHLAEDLAALAPGVTQGHLVTGPALLEPAQALHPDHAPWDALSSVAGLGPGATVEPGVTSLGTHRGRAPGRSLLPRDEPRGLFVVLPMLLAAPDAGSLGEQLERELFDRGGLRPPAMATLADATGLDPVHGQLMTRADLMALLKMQLAGVSLDPFWPPIEHALLTPDEPLELALPAGLHGRWDAPQRRWLLDFLPLSDARPDADWLLWLRSFRQTAAMLESHLIEWRARPTGGAQPDPTHRWIRCPVGRDRRSARAWTVTRDPVGLVAISGVVDGRRYAYHPLAAGVADDIRSLLRARGGSGFAVTADLDWLRAPAS